MKVPFAVAVGAVLLAGCAPSTGDLDAADSPVARYDWSGGSAMAALLEGTLELRDGCLIVNLSYDPYTPAVAVFPRTYAAWDAETSVLTYAGREYGMGDSVSAGGGGGNVPDERIPAACLPFINADEGVFYIQDADLEPYVPGSD